MASFMFMNWPLSVIASLSLIGLFVWKPYKGPKGRWISKDASSLKLAAAFLVLMSLKPAIFTNWQGIPWWEEVLFMLTPFVGIELLYFIIRRVKGHPVPHPEQRS